MMLSPPDRYRLCTEQMSISAPLRPSNITFLHESGCRKIITLAGGFVSADVVAALKSSRMEVIHFPLECAAYPSVFEGQVTRILQHIAECHDSGSKLHVACGPEMVEAAVTLGLFRTSCNKWKPASALSECLEVCRFVDAETVSRLVLETEISL